MKNFKIKSYCKINLSLKVIKKLNNGYHNITSLITFCGLHDIISISTIKRFNSHINIYMPLCYSVLKEFKQLGQLKNYKNSRNKFCAFLYSCD